MPLPLHLFLSYSRYDLTLVTALHDILATDDRFKVWLDIRQIAPTDDWANAIQRGLESSHIVLVVVSRYAVRSPYVMDEWTFALEHGKRVIVLLVDNTPVDERLETLPCIDLRPFIVDVELERSLPFQDLLTVLENPAAPTPTYRDLPRRRYPRGLRGIAGRFAMSQVWWLVVLAVYGLWSRILTRFNPLDVGILVALWLIGLAVMGLSTIKRIDRVSVMSLVALSAVLRFIALFYLCFEVLLHGTPREQPLAFVGLLILSVLGMLAAPFISIWFLIYDVLIVAGYPVTLRSTFHHVGLGHTHHNKASTGGLMRWVPAYAGGPAHAKVPPELLERKVQTAPRAMPSAINRHAFSRAIIVHAPPDLPLARLLKHYIVTEAPSMTITLVPVQTDTFGADLEPYAADLGMAVVFLLSDYSRPLLAPTLMLPHIEERLVIGLVENADLLPRTAAQYQYLDLMEDIERGKHNLLLTLSARPHEISTRPTRRGDWWSGRRGLLTNIGLLLFGHDTLALLIWVFGFGLLPSRGSNAKATYVLHEFPILALGGTVLLMSVYNLYLMTTIARRRLPHNEEQISLALHWLVMVSFLSVTLGISAALTALLTSIMRYIMALVGFHKVNPGWDGGPDSHPLMVTHLVAQPSFYPALRVRGRRMAAVIGLEIGLAALLAYLNHRYGVDFIRYRNW